MLPGPGVAPQTLLGDHGTYYLMVPQPVKVMETGDAVIKPFEVGTQFTLVYVGYE